MATWNGAPTLPKVLEACCRLAPPADGWSLLIVDDGSTDGTREVIGDFAARLPLQLVSQARRAAMALHARAEVEANYAPQLMAQRVRAFYAGLLP
jgi:glycosyltransferase involved in cell wall biosynthesis